MGWLVGWLLVSGMVGWLVCGFVGLLEFTGLVYWFGCLVVCLVVFVCLFACLCKTVRIGKQTRRGRFALARITAVRTTLGYTRVVEVFVTSVNCTVSSCE